MILGIIKYLPLSNNLEEQFRVEKLDIRLGNVNGTSGESNGSLGGDSFALFIGLCFLFIIFLDSAQESFSAR